MMTLTIDDDVLALTQNFDNALGMLCELRDELSVAELPHSHRAIATS